MDIFDFIKQRGNQTMIAKALDLTPQAVSFWVSTKKIPTDRVVELEIATGIPRQQIKPELFGEI